MALPLIVSFYTPDGDYPAHARQLTADCLKHGLEHCIVQKPSLKSWLGNCRVKPQFIKEMLLKHQRPILWIDVDSRILRPHTELNDPTWDIALHRSTTSTHRQWHVYMMGFNLGALPVLDCWIDKSKTTLGSDDSAFEEARKTGILDNLKVYECKQSMATLPRQPRHPNQFMVTGISVSPVKTRELQALKKVRGW